MNRVAVIMSTYNGEAYVREQLESILNQRDVEVSVFVRDDGSEDRTAKIIQEYDKVHFIQGENIGLGNSFMNLLYSVPSDYDYYALSDQDDFWENIKLNKAIALLKQENKQLYISNQKCVDKDKKFIMMRYSKTPKLSPIDVLSQNKGTGCTMVFSKEFKALITEDTRRPSEALLKVRTHDVWITMIGALTNSIVYDPNAYILYRQHGNNVVGAFKPSLGKRINIKIKKIKNPQLRNGRSLLAAEIIKHYKDYASAYPILFVCARYKTNIQDKFTLLSSYSLFKEYNNIFTFWCYIILGIF